MKKNAGGILKALSSLQLTVALLLCISGLCLVGTVFPQDGSRAAHGLASAIPRLLSPYDVFHSIWFIGAGILLCINLVLCMRKRAGLSKRRLLMLLLHGGIILVVAGYALGFTSLDGFLEIPEGSSQSRASLKNGGFEDLGFSVRCDRFVVEYYQNGMPSEFVSDLSFLKDGRVAGQAQLKVNHPARFSGISFYQESYNQHLSAVLAVADGKETAKIRVQEGEIIPLPAPGTQVRVVKVWSDLMGAGPAVKLLIEDPAGERYLWVLKGIEGLKARVPDLFEQMPGFDPAGFKPYTFSLEKLETSYATGIGVKRDPGVPLAAAGGALFLVSLLLLLAAPRAGQGPMPGRKGPAGDAQGKEARP